MLLFIHKTGTLHAMLNALSRGYRWYVQGEVPAERADALVHKFAENYHTELPWWTRTRRAKEGKANASFFVHPTYRRPSFSWWLLVSNGDHPARAGETLRDAHERRQRIVFQDEYEALMVPAAKAVPRWTWRMTADFEQQLRGTVVEAIRHRRDPRAIREAIRTYHSLPGFRGIRSQVNGLRAYTAAEWKRTKAEDVCPFLPAHMPPYTRFQTYRTVPLAVVRERILAGKPPYSLAMRYGSGDQETPERDASDLQKAEGA